VGSSWHGIDYSRTEQRIPVWAIVLAVVFAGACLLGLLFLLIKEDVTTGHVEVRVQSGSFWHISPVPVRSRAQVTQTMAYVAQIQAYALHQGGAG
jgi:hypothetical protein